MKPLVLTLGFVLLAGLLLYGRTINAPEPGREYGAKVREQYLMNIMAFDSSLSDLESALKMMDGDSTSVGAARRAFLDARRAYKRMEFLVEHFTPVTARAINGPVLNEVEADDPTQTILAPEGLQVIEEQLYAEPVAGRAPLLADLASLRSSTRRLQLTVEASEFSDQNVFDAMRREVVRIISLGLAGFDAAAAQSSVRESAAALDGMQDIYTIYADDLGKKAPALRRSLDSLFDAAIAHLESNPDFILFDRLRFIRVYANPISSGLMQAQQALNIPFPEERRAISVRAATIFDSNAFDPLFFAPPYALESSEARTKLGRMLFFDPVLSGDGRRACASCHRPELAYTDGEARSVAFNFNGSVERNAPTLINAGLQGASFYDRRVTFLEDQAAAVLSNPTEMHGSMIIAVDRLRSSPEYVALFDAAFGGGKEKGISDLNIRIALASYVRSLVSYNAPFDRYMRGADNALSEPAKRGFNVFMGKAKCGTCHFMPLFNGVVPPGYTDTESEILGVTERFDLVHPKLDPDVGRFAVDNVELGRFAFKTPTLRNIEMTAPYMHNGAFASLEEVMEFYDRGGGAGLGLDVPNQTLPSDPLHLTEQEEGDIIAFLKSLTDTTGLAQRPAMLPRIEGTTAARRSVGGEY